MTNIFYSQFGEDKVLSKLFRGQSAGTCIEVGANDGVNDSNTYFFERLGWKCVLIEPNPDLCEQIRAKRSAILHECAASDETGVATLNIAEGAERSHGVSTIRNDDEALEKIRSYGFSPRPVRVKKRRLDDILTESNISPGFEFLTIDVEGHEHEVLKGLDLARWHPSIVIVEDNSYFRDPLIRKYLSARGYSPFLRTGVNDWYAETTNKALLTTTNKWRYYLFALAVKLKRSPRLAFLRGIRRWLKRS